MAAAKLLRSITVNRKNKTVFQPMCLKILTVLKDSDGPLRVPLTATIWNLSSIRPNRDELMKDCALDILADLLLVSGELQGEAAGALRNLTLDDVHLGKFSETNVIENMLTIIDSLSVGPRATCVLNSIRNLSLKDENHEKIMAGGAGIASLLQKLQATTDLSDQRYVLETISNLSKNEAMKPILVTLNLEYILMSFLGSANEPLYNAAQNILTNLKVSKLSDSVINSNKLIRSPDYLSSLVQHLDESMTEKDINFLQIVGEGGYGTVYRAEFNGYPVACKVIRMGLSQENAKKILDELRLLQKLKHPNVVLLMGACLNSRNQIMIVTEYAARGDLKHCLKDVNSIAKRSEMAQHVATGLNWMQSKNIVHRDLKLDNLLVTEDWIVKITDFGLSIEMESGTTWDRFGGNIKYSAPEILKMKYSREVKQYAYGEKTDVYSFGLLWWQILTKGDPFNPRPDRYNSKDGLANYILEGNRPAIPPSWPISLKTMISNCWSQSASMRPTFRAILDSWDKLALDLLCPDPLGRRVAEALWSDSKAKPDCHTFFSQFIVECMSSKLKEKDRKSLEMLVKDSAFDDTVSLGRFCYVVGWFGPLKTNCSQFFHRMKDLTAKPYFHGFLSDYQTEAKLTHLWESTSEKKSFYLIKYSMETIGEFKLSYIDVTKMIHNIIIRNVDGVLKTDSGHEFDNWKKLKNGMSKLYDIGKNAPR